jgi:rhamnosyltransferase subunit B
VAGEKIVLANFGSFGDVHPLIAVALALQARGTVPVIATLEDYRDKIESEGIVFAPVRPAMADVTAATGLDMAGVVAGMVKGGDAGFLIRDVVLPQLEGAYTDALAACDGASLVLTGTLAFGARLAALKLGIPWLSLALQPQLFLSGYDVPMGRHLGAVRRIAPILGPRLTSKLLALGKRSTNLWMRPEKRLRQRLGLPRGAGSLLLDASFSPLGTIALYSPLLGRVQPDFPPRTEIAGFAHYDRETGGAKMPAKLERFLGDGEPPIVFTLGSSLVLASGDFYAMSVAAARSLGRRAVLLTGDDARAHALAAPDICTVPYAPHSSVFPRGAAIVHHGGIGTLGHALASGVPQLIVPFCTDQPDNARRAARLGVADVVPQQRYNADSAARALHALLTELGYREQAVQAGHVVARENGATRAAEIALGTLHAQRAGAAPPRVPGILADT